MSPVYEMLWDCAYCGTRKLLGKTHRFCPKCGAPQDPKARYFPSDEEKVAVEDHVFVGVDKKCAACGAPMGAAVVFCSACGSPLEGAREVALVSEDAAPAVPRPVGLTSELGRGGGPRWGRRILLGCSTVLLALVAGFCALTRTHPVTATVTARAWERTVRVETFAEQRAESWCSDLPSDARQVSRSREVRSHRRVPNGEDCRTRRVDQGDGTFRQERECTPRYREEPIYDDRCRYTVVRWSPGRNRTQAGRLPAEPQWPALDLRTGSCLGCEREAGRDARYVASLSVEGNAKDCVVPEALWRSLADGATVNIEVGRIIGFVDCKSLHPR